MKKLARSHSSIIKQVPFIFANTVALMERADDAYLLRQMTQEGTEHPRRCGQKSMRVGHLNETELCKTNAAFSTRKFKP